MTVEVIKCIDSKFSVTYSSSISHAIHKYVNHYQLDPGVSGLHAHVIVQHAPIKVKTWHSPDEHLIFKIFLRAAWKLHHSLSTFCSQ